MTTQRSSNDPIALLHVPLDLLIFEDPRVLEAAPINCAWPRATGAQDQRVAAEDTRDGLIFGGREV
jgi:hypothetical protein